MSAQFASVLVIAVVLASDLWVYADAKRCVEEGAPVVLRIGTFVLDTPVRWFLSCLILWVAAFPGYLVSRRG
jgi:hypothetical protein